MEYLDSSEYLFKNNHFISLPTFEWHLSFTRYTPRRITEIEIENCDEDDKPFPESGIYKLLFINFHKDGEINMDLEHADKSIHVYNFFSHQTHNFKINMRFVNKLKIGTLVKSSLKFKHLRNRVIDRKYKPGGPGASTAIQNLKCLSKKQRYGEGKKTTRGRKNRRVRKQ